MFQLRGGSLYERAFRVVASTLAIVDPHGTIIDVNDSWKQFGRDNGLDLPHHGIGSNYLRVCESSDLPEAHAVARGIRSVLAGELREYVHAYTCHSPHEKRWYQVRVTRFRDGPNAMVVHENITECKHTEEILREQVQFTQGLLAHSPDVVQLLNDDGEVIWMNESERDGTRSHDAQPALGTNWLSAWPEEAHDHLRKALQDARHGKTGRAQTSRRTNTGLVRHDDVVITALGAPRVQFLCTIRDVTDVHDAQAEAQRHAEEAARILRSIQEAFFALDEELSLTYVNPRAEELLPQPAATLVGRHAPTLFPDVIAAHLDQACRTARQKRHPVHFEGFHAAFGRWLHVSVYPHALGFSVLVRDVTKQKLEEQAQRHHNRILEMTVHGQPLQDILHEVARMVEMQFPALTCAVLLVNAGRLRLIAAPSVPIHLQQALNGALDDEDVHAVTASYPERPQADHLAAHPICAKWRTLPLPAGMRACIALPIADGGESVLGALALFAANLESMTHDVIAVAERARQVGAVAIEHHRLSERLLHQAQYDPLTGLANRALFEETLSSAMDAAARRAEPLAVLFVDLNDFKSVNDSLGHHAGDEVLREFARRVERVVHRSATVARISGDEFTVVLPFTDEDDAVRVARSILDAVGAPFSISGREVFVTASIGVTLTPDGGRDAQELHRSADLAMYHAKSSKSGFAVYREEMSRRAYERFQLATSLRRAVEHNELELHYQPQVTLRDSAILGVEALLRWRHPDYGLMSPVHFVPLAEETGLIIPLGEWVLREACRQGRAWQCQGHRNIRVAVNVSALQFERKDFVDVVAACLQETNFPATQLELELTERLVMRDVDESVLRMRQLRDLGVQISVDDFGTGYSSLSYLPRLPINVLKIDGSFVSGLSPSSATFPVVQAILSLARSLGLESIAEGIETQEELRVLRDLGCGLGQGYYFAPPRPADDVDLVG